MIVRRIATASLLTALVLTLASCKKKEEESSGGGSRSPSTKRDDITSTTDTKKAEPKANEKFVGMNEWVQVGDVRVRVTRAKVQKVPLIKDSGSKAVLSADPELMVQVEIENLSGARKIPYKRWYSGSQAPSTKLTDEHANTYRCSMYSGGLLPYVEGTLRYGEKEMRPGEALADTLCFERPVGAATELTLVLGAIQKGEKESYRFKLLAADWK